MSKTLETVLRSIGLLIAIAILGFIANATNLTALIGPNWSALLASVAGIALTALDAYKSPTGTVAFGSIGKAV